MNPSPSARAPLQALLRPRFFFPALAALVVLSALLTPQAPSTQGAPHLTTHSTAANGASGLAETVARLGWRVARLDVPPSDTLPTDVIYAVLVSDEALTRGEAHTLLDRVRAGASLLVLAGGGVLRDSLHVGAGQLAGELGRRGNDTAACPTERSTLRNIATTLPLLVTTLSWSGPLPRDTVHLATARRRAHAARDSSRQRWPVALGIPLGRGRIVTIADQRLLTNDVIRVCHWGASVVALRALEWLARRDGLPPRRTVVFDEYHQGFGRHPSVRRAAVAWLSGTRSGRTAAQLIVAGLLLLAAVAPRPLPPLARRTIARRSPLEHVGALAQAYERVRATRTAARLLVQGLRRRVGRVAGTRRVSDEEFLAAVAARNPAIAAETARAGKALTHPVEAAELLDIANGIDRIEGSIRS